MLDIECFKSATEPGEGLTYYGANVYHITYNYDYHNYVVTVNPLDENGGEIHVESDEDIEEYAASTLSRAIAVVEQIEQEESENEKEE